MQVQFIEDLYIFSLSIKTFFSQLEADQRAKEINQNENTMAIVRPEHGLYMVFELPRH